MHYRVIEATDKEQYQKLVLDRLSFAKNIEIVIFGVDRAMFKGECMSYRPGDFKDSKIIVRVEARTRDTFLITDTFTLYGNGLIYSLLGRAVKFEFIEEIVYVISTDNYVAISGNRTYTFNIACRLGGV